MNSKPQTVYDKIWSSHLVGTRSDGLDLLYIDRHLLHEVTSPQAFEGLKLAHRQPWRRTSNLATVDHAIPTTDRSNGVSGIQDAIAKEQVITLDQNCREFQIEYFDLLDARQGIVHVVGPEQGATLPGMTIVCGDSHTSTHGAFGALAHGIGTSEVEHVLATQCLVQQKSKNFEIEISGELGPGVYAKDLILALIRLIGTAGATGHTIEYTGRAIEDLSIEGRMTVCNMSIEGGARAGLIGIDDKLVEYLEARPFAPKGALWNQAVDYWFTLNTDDAAIYDQRRVLDVSGLSPQVSWGTNPEMVVDIDATIPAPTDFSDANNAEVAERSLSYMGLTPGMAVNEIQLDKVFIGSCTNSRIEDLREASKVVKGRKVASRLKGAYIVPGSGLVKRQAEQEGLDEVFKNAGFEWREPGCSMCLAMNDDRLYPGERCASTSNRNFEGRQGHQGRTHLVSPATAAASAIRGTLADVREML
ncbi:MAG: 3-isopropylmalate dehydratase large subunit [Gammaproteobacteria bacterium]|nr:3-isopropylmalate dehydratase large subunit [Gammaproteobacteria bacterium]MYC26329.1 3-isopropylmalate dehydratase large subunit [Gammaproteobacteria bacterium]